MTYLRVNKLHALVCGCFAYLGVSVSCSANKVKSPENVRFKNRTEICYSNTAGKI